MASASWGVADLYQLSVTGKSQTIPTITAAANNACQSIIVLERLIFRSVHEKKIIMHNDWVSHKKIQALLNRNRAYELRSTFFEFSAMESEVDQRTVLYNC